MKNRFRGRSLGLLLHSSGVVCIKLFCQEIFVDSCLVTKPYKLSLFDGFTNEIKSVIKQKQKLWYRVKSSKSSLVKEEYIRVCKKLKQKIRSSKNNYELEITNRSKRDPKLVYKYVKSQQNVNEQVRALVDKDGHLVTDRKLVAEILNDQYKSVFAVEPE